MRPDELSLLLSRFPQAKLAITPTPLCDLPRLSAELGGPRILIKRDDMTGLAFGGNKIRQLEFFVGEALAVMADVFIAGGNIAQSNHSRAAAAAARAVGLTPVIAVRPGDAHSDTLGNSLLTRLLASDVRVIPELADVPKSDRLAEVAARRVWFERLADEYRQRGHRPYMLVGTSVPLGAMGYVKASIELNEQFAEMQIEPNWVVVNSTGATQAGLLLGSTLLERSYSVAGMAYLPTGGEGGRWVAELCNGAASLLDLGVRVQANEVINDDREAGEGYGLLTENAVAAFKLLLSTEGIFLDPVYGAKGLAGLIRWIRDGRLRKHDTVVFVHTGGLPALFAYASELLALNVAPADAKFPGG